MERVGDGPLYKCSWDSSNLSEGIHDIVVVGVDEEGHVSNITDVISLSGDYREVTYWMYRINVCINSIVVSYCMFGHCFF